MFDLIIRGGEAILPERGRTECDIAVNKGRIAAVLTPGTDVESNKSIDASGHVILPGVIDVHLHLGHGADISRPRVPEDADRETDAAARGGVTCMIPYLMAAEPFQDIFDDVREVTEAGSRIDFGYHFIISTEEQLGAVSHYVEMGAPSFKIFMNNRGGEGARLGLPDIDDGFLFRLAEAAAASGGMVCPHPENIEVAWVLRARAMEADPEGKGGLAAWDATRPAVVEADAVQRAALLTNVAGAPLYIVHTSSALALEAGLMHRRAGAKIYLETCPHYLTHDVNWAGGEIGKINPPLRHTADRERLWQGIANGEIDTVATDHVHREIGAKQGGIWKASPGCPGMETLLPLMLTEGYHGRGIPLLRIVQLLSEKPAQIMGLGHRKGRISVGMDADLAIVNLDETWTVDRDNIVSSAGYSIYEGWQMKGKVRDTLVRGSVIMRDGVPVDAARGWGRFVPRYLESSQETGHR